MNNKPNKKKGWLALLALAIARSIDQEVYQEILSSLRDDEDDD